VTVGVAYLRIAQARRLPLRDAPRRAVTTSSLFLAVSWVRPPRRPTVTCAPRTPTDRLGPTRTGSRCVLAWSGSND